MPIDRSALKRRAHEVIVTSNPRVITAALIYLVICVVLQGLGTRVLSVNISQSEAMNYLNYAANGNYEYALKYAEGMQPPNTAYLIEYALRLIRGVVGAGFLLFLLNTIRNNSPSFGNLLDGFGFGLRIVLLNILIGVFTFLWGLLLVVPGIVAHYRYSQAIYLLIDNPQKSPMQCLRESSRLVEGHKMELFKLDLSFIGWYLLGLIPYAGYAVRVWSVPYIAMTKALFYEQLHGNNVWSYTPDYPA